MAKYLGIYPNLCARCIAVRGAYMLSGYCVHVACDACGRVTDCAMTKLTPPAATGETFTTAPGMVCGNLGCECSQRATVRVHYRDGGK